MRRRLVNLPAALSLMLCVATAGVLTSNQWREGYFARIGSDHSVRVDAANGVFAVFFFRTDPDDTPRWFAGISQKPKGPTPGHFRWDRLGFDYGVGGTRGGNAMYAWVVPDWFLIVAFATWPALRWIRRRRLARRPPGMCRVCGYDLRATPDRCPECGAVPDGSARPAA
jgi:hypothetical protein